MSIEKIVINRYLLTQTVALVKISLATLGFPFFFFFSV